MGKANRWRVLDLRAEEAAQDALHGEDQMIDPIPHDYLEYEKADYIEDMEIAC